MLSSVRTRAMRRIHETLLVAASDEALKGYGCLVETPTTFPIEIVRWPAEGWRPVDNNSGDQGGVTEACSNSGGRAKRFTRATTRSATRTCSLEHLARGGENRWLGRASALSSGGRTNTPTAASSSMR
jgi:hypothetical protein